VISICELHEVVPAMTRPRLPIGGRNRLHEHSGRVSRDAERVRERVVAHRGDHGRSDRHPELLEPATHRAAIDASAEPREAILLAMEWQAVAELVARDVREQRRRGRVRA
jgi:hypothetical protein